MSGSRTAEEIRDDLLSRLPEGWAWSRRSDSDLAGFLRGPAVDMAAFEAAAERMLPQSDPGAAVELLGDYERVLGPDPCGRDTGPPLSLEERQRIARQRWTGRGRQDPAYYVQLAAGLGYTISIEEFWPSVCGRARCGRDRLMPWGAQFYWRVTVYDAGPINSLECVFQRQAQSHTIVVFRYEAP